MTTRLPSTRQALAQIAHIEEVMRQVHGDIADILRRGRFDASDGYPSASMGGGGGGSEVSRPTERAALQLATRRPQDDPVLNSIRTLCAALEQANQAAMVIGSNRAYILALALEEHGRQNTIPTCVNPHCAEPLIDRGRAGRCKPCYEYRRRHDGRDAPADMVAKRREDREQRAS